MDDLSYRNAINAWSLIYSTSYKVTMKLLKHTKRDQVKSTFFICTAFQKHQINIFFYFEILKSLLKDQSRPR
jgi:hypothetical protein